MHKIPTEFKPFKAFHLRFWQMGQPKPYPILIPSNENKIYWNNYLFSYEAIT